MEATPSEAERPRQVSLPFGVDVGSTLGMGNGTFREVRWSYRTTDITGISLDRPFMTTSMRKKSGPGRSYKVTVRCPRSCSRRRDADPDSQ